MKSNAGIRKVNITAIWLVLCMTVFARTAIGDIIIDNGGSGTTFTGAWYVSGASGYYGTDSLWARDGATYTWTMSSQPAGNYEVFMWWSPYTSRATAISTVITHAGGQTPLTINQQQDGGQWISLGTYNFNGTGAVRITAANGSTVSTCADAVWFKAVTSNQPPTAVIDSITPNPANYGQPVQFTGHGTDTDGTIQAYSWESSINGYLTNTSSFSEDKLSSGVHTIIFEVQDNNGAWSASVEQTLVIEEAPADIIIDNGSPECSYTGSWNVSNATGAYGTNSLFGATNGATYSWAFTPTTTGTYSVSMWWTSLSSRVTNAPVSITNEGTTANLTVNQTANGGQWNELGQYTFNAGTTYRVTITAPNMTPPSTCADAVKFTLIQEPVNVPPTATINSITPNPAIIGQNVTFAGSGTDSDGTVTAYSWTSSIEGNISNSNTFSTSALSAGTHTIIFEVQDDDGAWSTEVLQTLTVGSPLTEIIIDNGDANTSYTGSWTVSAAAGAYGSNSIFGSSNAATYTWTFRPETSGTYKLSMWWTSIPTRKTNVPVNIEHNSGTTSATLNQTQNGGKWNEIGQYTFIAGTLYDVTITSGATSTPSTCADAIKFTLVSVNNAPVATIDSILPNPATEGQNIQFKGHGSDTDGTIAGYRWISNIDGQLSDANWFTINTLSAGTHTITLEVRDNGGMWSDAISTIVTINEITNVPPTAAITSITPNPATVGQAVSFVGSGTDTDGTIAAYIWQSSIDGDLSYASSFSKNNLSAGSHTITFAVQDDDGEWSANVSRTLTVSNPSIEVIIDNGASGTSSTGTWRASGASGAYGTNSLFAATNGATYRWSFTPTTTGTYTVSMWWTALASRVTSAPVSITNAGTTANLTVNQTTNGGKWNVLGQYTFNAGTTYRVTITAPNMTPPSTCADAVKFTLGGASVNVPPVATIDSISPNPATSGQTVSFSGTGADTDGTVTAYVWTSNIDGALSTQSSFTKNNLSIGTHTISFRVQDNAGAWSSSVTSSLVIKPAPPADIVIDNGSANCTYTGSWATSEAAGYYGTDAYWSRDGATYTWRVTPVSSANYEVFAWWSSYTTRSTNVPIDITNANGTTRVNVNQQINGGQWNSLGIFPFQAGVTYNITVTAVNGSTISTCADAVKLSYNGPITIQLPPVAQILSISPNPGMPNQTIAFKGKATDTDGTITAYSWRSNIDGTLGTTSTMNKTLTAGTHTVYFKAQDNTGLWSPEVSATVDVGLENIYIAQCYGGNEVGVVSFRGVLQSLGATKQSEDEWTYVDTVRNKTYYIHFVKNGASLVSAMARDGAHIILSAHSNYGIGPNFSTSAEDASAMITNIRYVDDDRFVKLGTPMVSVSAYGMRTGQAYPYWWPIYKDGKSAIAPYDFGDPNGPPAYNYYLTYRIPGDPNCYKVSTVNKSEIQRFSDSSKPAWYSITGEKPDPNKPEHKQFFITNSEVWRPSIESSGTWTQYQDPPIDRVNSQYFKENYVSNSAGTGSDYTKFLFTIPQSGQYNVRAWWPGLSTNANNTPFIVRSANGDTTVRVNQTINGRQWNELGTYTFNPGDYFVNLTDNVSSGNVIADGIQIGHVDNPEDIVQSDFVAISGSFPLKINPSGPAPLNVMLVNTSSGDLTGREWNCGDGFTNTTRDQLSHIYERPGIYTVTLKVTGPLGTSTRTKTNYITVWPEGTTGTDSLRAEFAAMNKFSSQGAATLPMAAMFYDISTGDLRKGITYTPTSSFSGIASLTYTVKDAMGNVSNPATVNITVGNNLIAKDDTAITSPKNPVTIKVLSNDKAPAGKLLADSIQITANPSYGTIDINDIGGYIVYRPTSQTLERNDTFKYTAADSNGHVSNQATVSVKITNHPVAGDDIAYTKKGTKTTINVLGNDVDSDGLLMPNSVQVNISPTNGTIDVNHVSGLITYTPLNATFSGQDLFRYSVADNDNLISNQALVTVKVDNNPTANDDGPITAVGKPITIDITGNDNSMFGSLDPNSITITSGPASGSYVIHKNTWLWNFGDGTTSRDQNPVHLYTQPGIFNVSLKVTDATGATQTETKQNYIRVVVYEKNIDNVDYPKSSYGGWVGKTMLKTRGMDIPYDSLKYGRMLYESCNSGDYYIQTLSHGLMYYTIATSGGSGSLAYLQLYLQGGKTDKEIWEAMQQTQACYDFYNFNLRPSEQPTIPMDAMTASAPAIIKLNADQLADIEEMKTSSIEDAFYILTEPQYVANSQLSETAAGQAFANKEVEAITYSLNKLQALDEMSDYEGASELKAAKTILSQFPDTSIPKLLNIYPQTDIISKANLLAASGSLACDNEIRDMFLAALDDKTETINTNPELVGHPLRICDIAYNQLVLNLKVNNVLRTIGTGMADDIRDYHIEVLKAKL
ncbi:MAG: PKD domain-containing protein [Phycisphaerales bacterium]